MAVKLRIWWCNYVALTNRKIHVYSFLRSSILVPLESCLQTCMTDNIAEGTVNKFPMKDKDELSETCGVL